MLLSLYKNPVILITSFICKNVIIVNDPGMTQVIQVNRMHSIFSIQPGSTGHLPVDRSLCAENTNCWISHWRAADKLYNIECWLPACYSFNIFSFMIICWPIGQLVVRLVIKKHKFCVQKMIISSKVKQVRGLSLVPHNHLVGRLVVDAVNTLHWLCGSSNHTWLWSTMWNRFSDFWIIIHTLFVQCTHTHMHTF